MLDTQFQLGFLLHTCTDHHQSPVCISLYISKTTKNLSLLDTFHHFSAVQQAHKITQVESTRKWTSGITDNIIISSNYRLNTKRIFSISYLSYLLCHHSRIAAAARRAPLHYCPSCRRRHTASCRVTVALPPMPLP